MTIKAFARWATLAAALAAPVVALADNDKDTKSDEAAKDRDRDHDEGVKKTEKLTDNEIQILAHMHHVNQMEIDLGKLAQKKATTQAIKAFGTSLVTDHTNMDKDLLSFAKKHDTKVPMEKAVTEAEKAEMKETQAAVAKLRAAKASEFDRQYLMLMVDGHEKELAKVDTNKSLATNADLRQMLDDAKPMLQRHADQARDLQKSNAQASTTPAEAPRP
jgi:putative membrane protein